MTTPQDEHQRKQQLLARAFGFSEEALRYKRGGRLHHSQVPRLKKKQNFGPLGLAVLLGLLFLFALCYSVVGLIDPSQLESNIRRTQGPDIRCFYGFYFIVSVSFLLITAYSMLQHWIKIRNYANDIKQAEVINIEGPVMLRIKTTQGHRRSWTSYLVQITGQEFTLESQEFLALENGCAYRLYYTPHSRMVVAAELIEDKPKP
jgi:hypothetical protein